MEGGCGLDHLAQRYRGVHVYVGYIAMARRHAVFQAFQFDPESDPDEEVATQRLQQDVSEWLV